MKERKRKIVALVTTAALLTTSVVPVFAFNNQSFDLDVDGALDIVTKQEKEALDLDIKNAINDEIEKIEKGDNDLINKSASEQSNSIRTPYQCFITNLDSKVNVIGPSANTGNTDKYDNHASEWYDYGTSISAMGGESEKGVRLSFDAATDTDGVSSVKVFDVANGRNGNDPVEITDKVVRDDNGAFIADIKDAGKYAVNTVDVANNTQVFFVRVFEAPNIETKPNANKVNGKVQTLNEDVTLTSSGQAVTLYKETSDPADGSSTTENLNVSTYKTQTTPGTGTNEYKFFAMDEFANQTEATEFNVNLDLAAAPVITLENKPDSVDSIEYVGGPGAAFEENPKILGMKGSVKVTLNSKDAANAGTLMYEIDSEGEKEYKGAFSLTKNATVTAWEVKDGVKSIMSSEEVTYIDNTSPVITVTNKSGTPLKPMSNGQYGYGADEIIVTVTDGSGAGLDPNKSFYVKGDKPLEKVPLEDGVAVHITEIDKDIPFMFTAYDKVGNPLMANDDSNSSAAFMVQLVEAAKLQITQGSTPITNPYNDAEGYKGDILAMISSDFTNSTIKTKVIDTNLNASDKEDLEADRPISYIALNKDEYVEAESKLVNKMDESEVYATKHYILDNKAPEAKWTFFEDKKDDNGNYIEASGFIPNGSESVGGIVRARVKIDELVMFGANGADGMDVKNFLKINGGGVINSAVMSIKDEEKEDGSIVKVTVVDIEMSNLSGGSKITLELDPQVTDLCGNGVSLASKVSPEKTVMPVLAGSLNTSKITGGRIQAKGSNKGKAIAVNFEVNLVDINGNDLDPNISLYDLTYSLDAAGAKIATVAKTGSGKGKVTFKLGNNGKGNLIVKQNATKEELGGLEPAQFTIPIQYTKQRVTGVTITSKLSIKRKKSATAKVTKVLPTNATLYSGKRVWKSSKTSIATVNAAGKVTAKKKKGTAYITCTIDGRVSNKCKVTVK